MNLNEPVKLSFQLARAMEISIVGKHTISVYADLEEYPQAKSDVTSAIISYSRINNNRAYLVKNNADIMVCVTKPDFDNLFQQFETLENIQDRIITSRNNPIPSLDITNSSKALLKTAYEKLNLGVNQISSILRVSSTIAKMEGSDLVNTAHIAEAIQYQSIELSEVDLVNN